MSEIQQEVGREWVQIALRYLASTLKFDHFCDVYERNGDTDAQKLDNKAYTYDIKCAYFEGYNRRKRRTVYAEVKYRSSPKSDLGRSYDDFILKSFSVFLNDQKKKKQPKNRKSSYYLFFANYPFLCDRFNEIRSFDYINSLIRRNQNKYGIPTKYKLEHVQKFCDLVWVIIFCKTPQELFFHPKRSKVKKFLDEVYQDEQ